MSASTQSKLILPLLWNDTAYVTWFLPTEGLLIYSCDQSLQTAYFWNIRSLKDSSSDLLYHLIEFVFHVQPECNLIILWPCHLETIQKYNQKSFIPKLGIASVNCWGI